MHPHLGAGYSHALNYLCFLFGLLAGFLDFLLLVVPGQHGDHGVLHVGSEDKDQVGGHPHVNGLDREAAISMIRSLKRGNKQDNKS